MSVSYSVGDVEVAPNLTLKWLSQILVVAVEDAPVVVGRADNSAAKIKIADQRISREHLLLVVRDGAWVAVDKSTNGSFVQGNRLVGEYVIPDAEVEVMLGHPANGVRLLITTLDPIDVFVGAQIAKRREELGLAQRTLAQEKVLNAGALISIEKGRSKPRPSTAAKLEQVLHWPSGHIERLREKALMESGLTTERTVVHSRPETSGATTTIEASLMAETVAIGLTGVRAQITALPEPSDPAYPELVNRIISTLARLEQAATAASRGSAGLIRELSEIRRTYRDLMLTASKSPRATLGQKLYAVRHRAELSVEEVAAMAGINGAELREIETGADVPDSMRAELQRVLSALS